MICSQFSIAAAGVNRNARAAFKQGSVLPRPASQYIVMSAFVTLSLDAADFARLRNEPLQDTTHPGAREMDAFLAGVERKAFRIAQIALRHEDDALDAVQDAMLQLVRSYSQRPATEWRPLFYRILENRIRDMQRHRTVRGRLLSWLPFRSDEEDEPADPLAQAPDPGQGPLARLEAEQTLEALDAAITRLPARQRQAFLLRNFEGLDVAETAAAMGCSQGSAKTHYFRAVQALRGALGDFRP
jgi:RNA polymerase sigma-70 factor, ECF subfamily